MSHSLLFLHSFIEIDLYLVVIFWLELLEKEKVFYFFYPKKVIFSKILKYICIFFKKAARQSFERKLLLWEQQVIIHTIYFVKNSN